MAAPIPSAQLTELCGKYAGMFQSHRPDYSLIDKFDTDNTLSEISDAAGNNVLHALCAQAQDLRNDQYVKAVRYYLGEHPHLAKNLDFLNQAGVTPLMNASENSNVELCRYLIENGSSIIRYDAAGVSALMRACANDKFDILATIARSHTLKLADIPTIPNGVYHEAGALKFNEAMGRKDVKVLMLLRHALGPEFVKARYPNKAYDEAKNKQALAQFRPGGSVTGAFTRMINGVYNYFY